MAGDSKTPSLTLREPPGDNPGELNGGRRNYEQLCVSTQSLLLLFSKTIS
jgi:hypothetical protein